MRMMDLDPIVDLKAPVPAGLDEDEEISWRYQRYIKDYLRVVASIDDNVGRMLDYLDDHGLADNTIVVYTSDQGFFLGDHGWFDKRLMYEESLTMPFLVRYPGEVAAGSDQRRHRRERRLRSDVPRARRASTSPRTCRGARSSRCYAARRRPTGRGRCTTDTGCTTTARTACPAHYGVRTRTHKLICYYNDPLGQARRPRPVGAGGVGTVRSRRRSARGAQHLRLAGARSR